VFQLLRVSAFLTIISTFFLAESAFGSPTIEENQSLEAVKIEENVPLCYITTADNRVLDLSSFCAKQAVAASTNPPTPVPYNNSNIKKFDAELYGEDN